MDKRKNKQVIVLAIKPQYAKAILAGAKSVEFRKNGIPESISHMVLYSTLPEQMVVGYCSISGCVIAPPENLWNLYGACGAISRENFFNYYKNQKEGKAYLIERACGFVRPLNFSQFQSTNTPPQSFAYVKNSEWDKLKRKMVKVVTPLHKANSPNDCLVLNR
ncbi:conserved hypothetical protein-like protein [Desulfatibacillum aliphaticivorans]|uniref:ASCH domain-containing protein n=1 Tax=Desulfatibacillum aliphaticivorans TaxID=218208 RepID=B8FCL6_DESAL|nr:hypothetical protein [Desulfatibacillum aliphaticivorans]ACL06179.1 conserved hypothetical protein-like protein [Desulfatibacillum aliphaticivorans]